MRKVLVLATSCLLATSCVIDKREIVPAVDKYNEEFVKVFGETDPNHTWSMVENKKVEVNLTKPSNVKVYVKAGKDYHLAADYKDVSGSQQLSFDAPMGCEDVYVTVDGVPYNSVGSRTSIIPQGNEVISVGGKDDYRVYKYGELDDFFEDEENLSELPERQDNTKKVNMDYIAKAEEGKIYTFYPLFWNAHFSHTFGLYYYVGETKYEVDFYKDKEGDELQYYNASASKWENVTDNYVFSYIKNKGFNDGDNVLQCKPYTIKFPTGTGEFGFYVNVYESGSLRAKYYSNPKLNEANSISSFAYLEVGGNTYITIEDHNHDDFDYNDFIFVMEGEQEHIVDTPDEYIYAVEDLGNTDDFDFNDIVFSVSHVSGQPHATVKPLAAGGTLPAYICFKNRSYGEVHEMFKVATTEMVNTASGTTKANMKQASPFVVQVGTDWSHAAFSTEGNGFGVMVKKDGAITEVKTPGPGNNAAPQILILTKDWLWPTERTRIDKAYPGFGEWGANYTTNSTWVNEYNGSDVVDWVGASQTNP